MLVENARQLAEELVRPLGRRWQHVQAVAARAAELGAQLPAADREHLVAAAWLHDIGYAEPIAWTGFHPLDGARYLWDNEWPDRVVNLVAHHSGARFEADFRGMAETHATYDFADTILDDMLAAADLTTGPAGESFTFDERLAEIRQRYPTGSVVVATWKVAEPVMRDAVARAYAAVGATASALVEPILHLPRLCDGELVLRGLQPSDCDGRRVLGKDPEAARNFGRPSARTQWEPMTLEEAERWYAGARSTENPLFAIEFDGRFIGTADLHDINTTDRRARFGIGILDRDVRGRGIGTRATRLVLGYGFGELGLHRIDLRVLDFNTRAIACYQRVGFTIEGTERDSAFIDGAWHSDVIMSILEQEFTESRS